MEKSGKLVDGSLVHGCLLVIYSQPQCVQNITQVFDPLKKMNGMNSLWLFTGEVGYFVEKLIGFTCITITLTI